MALKRKKTFRFSMEISADTRADLGRLVKLSRTCNTKAAVISRIAMQYLAMLDRQLEEETAGNRLVVCKRAQAGEPEPLFELDLRL